LVAGFVGGVVFTLLGGCAVGAIGVGGSDDPLKGDKAACVDAWSIENDGDDDTKNETAILEQPWCDQYLQTVTTMTTTTEAQP
jgi:hypothetical protein